MSESRHLANNHSFLSAKARALSGGAHLVLPEIQRLAKQDRELPEWQAVEALCLAFTGSQVAAVNLWQSLIERGFWSAELIEHYCCCLSFLERHDEIDQIIREWFEQESGAVSAHPELLQLQGESTLKLGDDNKIQAVLSSIQQLKVNRRWASAALADYCSCFAIRAAIVTKDWEALGLGDANDHTPAELDAKADMLRAQLVLPEHFSEAVALQRHLMTLKPDNEEADYLLLYDYQLRLGKIADAEITLADAAEKFPDNPTVATKIIEHFVSSRDIELALLWFNKLEDSQTPEQASQLKPLAALVAAAADDLLTAEELITEIPEEDARGNDARILYYTKINDPISARHYQERKIADTGRSPRALLRGARLALETGDSQAAVALCEEVIDKNPHNLAANAILLHQGKAHQKLGTVLRIQRALINPSIPRNEQAALCHSLASFYHQCEDFLSSGTLHRRSNEIAESMQSETYSANKHSQQISRSIEDFPIQREYIRRLCSKSDTSAEDRIVPVFVVGVPRSGTTLTEQILARHPQCVGMGERPYFSTSVRSLRTASSLGATATKLRQLLQSTTNAPEADQIAIEAFRSEYRAKLLAHYPKTSTGRAGDTRTLFVDKMPDNYQNIGWICELLPNARVIYVARDARDILLSCWRANFGMINWAFRPETIAQRIIDHYKIMDFWLDLYGDQILTRHYSELVHNPEQQIREMLAHLELDWHPDCLDQTKSNSVVRTASVLQVRQPIYTSSVGGWENYSEELTEAIGLLERAGVVPP